MFCFYHFEGQFVFVITWWQRRNSVLSKRRVLHYVSCGMSIKTQLDVDVALTIFCLQQVLMINFAVLYSGVSRKMRKKNTWKLAKIVIWQSFTRFATASQITFKMWKSAGAFDWKSI